MMALPKSAVARVIPAPMMNDHAPTVTHGTAIMVGDTQLQGVTSIVLKADVNNVWRAEIHCLCAPPEVSASAMVHVEPPLSWWRRMCLRLIGVHVVEHHHMDGQHTEWRLLKPETRADDNAQVLRGGYQPTGEPNDVAPPPRDPSGQVVQQRVDVPLYHVKPQPDGTVEKDACD